MSTTTQVVVLDNGGGLIKAGFGGERDPSAILPNCLHKPLASKKWLHPNPLNTPASAEQDLTSASVRRPMDRGYLINPDLQREIWSHLFTSILRINPSQSSLLLTEPLFSLPSIQHSLDELVFEDFNFTSLYVADSPSLVHLYETSRSPNGLLSKAQCSLVVDCGFSFTHASPVFQNFTLNYAVKRIDLGGKALTNYLKELISFRSVNVMDETFIIDDVKENLCFVSVDVPRHLNIARKSGKENLLRCTYVLPDGVSHTKGFVKYPEQANRYLSDGKEMKEDVDDHEEILQQQHENNRQKVDLTKNEFDLTNERFLVPEMIFRPADLGFTCVLCKMLNKMICRNEPGWITGLYCASSKCLPSSPPSGTL
ncbi:actin-related protein 6 isoform X2 [Lathyrus oleraceus]|uniref:actin-related protein 6 isoform X2 n=1 Tax=Pisum sativum TaxID=3888 RepID=UPI0021CFFCC7|nr:actin-related protein 6 isoform X2 [Pisum sativum]